MSNQGRKGGVNSGSFELTLKKTRESLRPTPPSAPRVDSPSPLAQQLQAARGELSPMSPAPPRSNSAPSAFEQQLRAAKASLTPPAAPAPAPVAPSSTMAQELRAAKAALKPTSGMSTMFSHVDIKRGGKHTPGESATDFLDFATQTRRDMTILAGTQSGQDIFDAISGANHKVTLQNRGQNAKHGGSHKATDSAKAMQPGVGSDSVVTHQPDRSQLDPRPHAAPTSSVLSLGHELIHSTHSATGTLQTGIHGPSGVKNEERQTVGDPSGARPVSGLPTENTLRADLAQAYKRITGASGEPIKRTKYGKKGLGF